MTDVSVSHRLADWFLGLTNLGGGMISMGDFNRESRLDHETEGGGDAVRAQVSHERHVSFQ